jgi:mono/diheme cytochrome c family protein
VRHRSDDHELERGLDRQLVLGLLFGALLFAGFPLYAIREPKRLATARAAQHAQYLTLGTEQYALHCAGCHGEGARGGGAAPTLAAREFLSSVSDQQMRWLIAGGQPGTAMSAYHIDLGGPFTDQHVDEVVVYLRSLEPAAPSVPGWRAGAQAPMVALPASVAGEARAAGRDAASPQSATPPTAPAREAAAVDGASAARYATLCAMCHGARGEGVANLAPAILTPAYLQSRSDAALLQALMHGVPGTAMRAFVGAQAGQLSADEAAALVQWMRGHLPPVVPERR